MAITSLSVLQAGRVFILVTKQRRDQGQSKNLTDELKSSRQPRKRFHLKTFRMSEAVIRLINSRINVSHRHEAEEPPLTFPWWGKTPHVENNKLTFSHLSMWIEFNSFVNVSPQLHNTDGQMGCRCCRMIKRWEVCLCLFPVSHNVRFVYFDNTNTHFSGKVSDYCSGD